MSAGEESYRRHGRHELAGAIGMIKLTGHPGGP
jgi:hypothetical protein